MKLLWLDHNIVRKVLDISGVMQAVEQAFKQHGLKKVQMPPKSYLYFAGHNGDLRTMPAYLEDQDLCGVKIVNVHPDNPSKGLPTVMALMILNSPSTGKPLAVMDGGYLTALRTGAAGGIAARYLAREDSKVLGIVGAGGQARTQLEAIAQVFSLEQVKVFDVDSSRSEAFRSQMGGIVKCNISICKDIREVCDCDILVTVTPVRKPLIMDDWIRAGTHINAIGADARGKEELEPALLTRSRVVVDDITQAVHSGEVNVPISEGIIKVADIVCELGEVVAGLHPGRTDDSQITIFDSTGLAIQDVSTAHLVYNRAIERGMGMDLDMF